MYAEYFLIFSSQYPIFTHNSNERPKKVHTQLSTKTIKVTENRSNQDHLTRRGLQKGYGQASTTRRGQKETSNLNSITFVAQIFLNRKEKKKSFSFHWVCPGNAAKFLFQPWSSNQPPQQLVIPWPQPVI
jgi:hypothetical protein